MKRKKFIFIVLQVTTVILLTASISFSAGDLWPKKEGELCWDVYSIPDSSDPTGFLRLYVMNIGKNYYLVNGSNEEIDHTPLVNGNAIIYPDKIVLHASSSGFSGEALDPSEVRGLLGTIILDPNTLNGSFRGVHFRYEIDSTPPIGSVSYDGVQTLVLVPCH